MKKILLISILALSSTAVMASPYGYLDAPNPVNRNFSGLMKQQFEKEETLDFINNPEEYKAKRAKKDEYLDYKEGKTEIPAYFRPKMEVEKPAPVTRNMEFSKDENGQIRIQGIR